MPKHPGLAASAEGGPVAGRPAGFTRGRVSRGRGHVAILILSGALGAAAAARAEPIEVGSGANQAGVFIQFSDGAVYEFDVAFDGTTTGLGLMDIIENDTTLTTERLFGGGFINGITYEDHSDIGYGGGENWWHYWIRDSDDLSWTSPSDFGAADRIVTDGDADGWVYGNANPPVPEPASAVFAGLTAVILACVRRHNAH